MEQRPACAVHTAQLQTARVWGRVHTCFCTRSTSSLSHRSRSSSARRSACSSFSRACSASSLRASSSLRLRSSATLRANSSIFCLGKDKNEGASLKRGQVWQGQQFKDPEESPRFGHLLLCSSSPSPASFVRSSIQPVTCGGQLTFSEGLQVIFKGRDLNI